MIDLAAAERGVRDLHARYTDAVFRKDFDAFAECFTRDGEWRISGRVFRGRTEIREAIAVILDNFVRVLFTARTPILDVVDGELVARTYIDEKCAWKNGNTNIAIGHYYERFAEEDGRWRFAWRLFETLYRGDPDLSGTFFERADYGPPPGMPPRDAETEDMASARWGLPPAAVVG
jgi:uncharacterized protein (TIGR02246 family)